MMVQITSAGTGISKAVIKVTNTDFSKYAGLNTIISYDVIHVPLILPNQYIVAFQSTATSKVCIHYVTWNSGTDLYTMNAQSAVGGDTISNAAVLNVGRGTYDSSGFVYLVKKPASNEFTAFKLDGTNPSVIHTATAVVTTINAAGGASTPAGKEVLWFQDPYLLIIYSSADFTQEGVHIMDKTGLTTVGASHCLE